MKRSFLLLAIPALAMPMQAQETPLGKVKLDEGLGYKVEMQGSVSNDRTPLWLNANRYGLSSIEKNNGYLRAAVERPLATDTFRR